MTSTVVDIHDLISMAQRGLGQMYDATTHQYAHTMRGRPGPQGPTVTREGTSIRYSAICALGLAPWGEEVQRAALAGDSLDELVAATVAAARNSPDLGSVALAAWAQAEVAGTVDPGLVARIDAGLDAPGGLEVVILSWIVSAGVAMRRAGSGATFLTGAADRLREAQGPGGLFPHVTPAEHASRWRGHVGCFADQVYPIQALARVSALASDEGALRAAEQCAEAIVELQGESGQWWWHYDARDRSVVEGYPVYSVHQHAMGPLCLHDLRDAGGRDHAAAVSLGLDWLGTHPEVMAPLVEPRFDVVWRKVARTDPKKVARALGALATRLRAESHVPGLDSVFPPAAIDYECRPYEFGWLLYAWKHVQEGS